MTAQRATAASLLMLHLFASPVAHRQAPATVVEDYVGLLGGLGEAGARLKLVERSYTAA